MVPMLALNVMVVHIQAKLSSQHSCGMQLQAGFTLQQGTFHGPLLALFVIAVHIQARLYSPAVACSRLQVAFSSTAHFMAPMLAFIVMVGHTQAKLYSQHSCGMQSHAGCTGHISWCLCWP